MKNKLRDIEGVGELVANSILESGVNVKILLKILSLKGGQREKVLEEVVSVFKRCIKGYENTMYLANSPSPPPLELNLQLK